MTRSLKRKRYKKELEKNIVQVFSENITQSFNYKQVAALLKKRKESDRKLILQVLYDLCDVDFLTEKGRGKFQLNAREGFIIGRVEKKGVKMYVRPEDGGDLVFIPANKLNRALNKDLVKVFLYARRKGFPLEGEIVEVIERSRDFIVGTLSITKYHAFLVVDNRILLNDIFIPKDKLKGGLDGQKAIVRILEWPVKAKNPVGEVVDVLGNAGDNDVEMHAILAEFGLPYSYPKKVEEYAAKIDENISKEEIKRRKDYREVTTFTIDPGDAKDFDDALSVQKLKNGHWEVGVHIADVTHYVKEGDLIDEEAEKRATSVYLVDRTVPMLPEKLSNIICSLRPDEDKLCFSVLFELTDEGDTLKYDIQKTLIRSNRRFTYEEAQTIIETGEGEYKEEILILNFFAKKLREARFEAGAIAFDRVEVRFEIDERGKPISVFFKEQKEANQLIEEFMLLANRTIASHIGKVAKGKKAKSFVYRIHDMPNLEKMENLSEFIRRFGYQLKISGKRQKVPFSINKLLDEVQGKKEQNLVETLVLRAMAKAVYSTKNIGHYGLSFEYYTHFTSPIRRYPDMLVHRLIKKYLENGKSESGYELENKCEHSSVMEQLAANAERASIKYKQVEFMSDKLGMIFDGVISGVTEWGVYVELIENKCEGMVPIRDLPGDYYYFDEKNYCLIGRRTNKKFSLGESVKVKVAKANLEKKQLDFILV